MADIHTTLHLTSREEEEREAKNFAAQTGHPYINLSTTAISGDVLGLIPRAQATQLQMVAFAKTADAVRLATIDPNNPGLKELTSKLREQTKLEVAVNVCSRASLTYALSLYDKLVKEAGGSPQVSVATGTMRETGTATIAALKDKLAKVSTTELLDTLFAGAMGLTASDIHLEPGETTLKVRYRIDGVLKDVVDLSMTAHKTLVSRIKFLAKLKLDVTTLPQDGRFEVATSESPLDIRVATLPTPYGEAVEMRLLAQRGQFLALESLGFSGEVLTKIKEAITKPHGLILNTGPTGSGKTTTLYAILQQLNQPGRKIISIEDPVEYRIPGIDQSQILPEKGYTYAAALKAALRHDPDIIMVGEIRDPETATTALQASLTGHLVLTTLHTNSAAAAIPRLMHIGIEPYLLAGAINLIIAQRLVRRIDPTCGPGSVKEGNSCFKGRLPIGEALVLTTEFNELIARKATVAEFEEAAKKTGMTTMLEDGKEKVAKGLTTIEEVLRVTRE
jgi:type II secretory ATPase GspE/PulE/Tfp pilus assembly ATPase PilB-like protein